MSAAIDSFSCRDAGACPDEPLQLDDQGLHWTGAATADDEAPRLTVHLDLRTAVARTLVDAVERADPARIDEAAQAFALPPGLLAAVARRCLAGNAGRVAAFLAEPSRGDPRWRRALASQIDGELMLPVLSATPALWYRAASPLDADAVLVLGDAVAVLERPDAMRCQLVLLREGRVVWRHEMAVAAGQRPLLLPDLLDEVQHLSLALHDAGTGVVQLWRWSLDGRLQARACFVCPTTPQALLVRGSRALVRADCDTLLVELETRQVGDEGPSATPAPRPPLLTSMERGGKWLLLWRLVAEIGGRVPLALDDAMHWVDVAGSRPDLVLPWHDDPVRLHVDAQALWVATPGPGVLRFDAADGQVTRLAQRADALITGHGRLVLGTGDHTHGARLRAWGLDAAGLDGPPLFDCALPARRVVDLALLPSGFAVLTDEQLFHVDRDGIVAAIGALAAPTHRLRVLTAASGVTAVHAEQRLWLLDGSGRVLGLHQGPGLALLGCTAAHHIAALADAAADSRAHTLLAIDAQAAVVALLERQRPGQLPQRAWASVWGSREPAAILGEGVLLVDGPDLRWWQPGHPGGGALRRARPEPLRPALCDQTCQGGETRSPRDDPPRAGLELTSTDRLALRCRFEGSTGVAPSPDVVVGDGAVLVLDRCELRTLQVRGRSTVLLIDCPTALEIDAEAGCQVLRVDRPG